jgi:aminoglycoside phosphotransferase (APT) family kinase protein
VTDKTVAFVGPPGGSAHAVVKLAGSVGAAQALAREAAAMRSLVADTRLGAWCALVPRLLDVSESGIPSIVESAVPGVDAARLLEVGADRKEVLKSITGAIGELHRLTRTELVVDQAILCDWVDEPLAVLERQAARAKRTMRLGAELENLKAEFRSALIGQHVIACSVHGDYVPANVVLDPDSLKVNGILDWESARTCDLPALDLAQLILAVRMLVRRREFGEVVLDALAAGWTGDERVLLAHVPDCGLQARELVLLAWLRHTASMLTKAPSYADNWLWTRANLEPVLA